MANSLQTITDTDSNLRKKSNDIVPQKNGVTIRSHMFLISPNISQPSKIQTAMTQNRGA